MECTNRTGEDNAQVGQHHQWDPTYAEQNPGSQCQRNRQWAGPLYHKALHPSPIHANIRPSQERHSILLHSHHYLAEPILLPSRHARLDLYMYPPAQNMGTLDSWPMPRYFQGHLCIFDNKCHLGCHDFDDSSLLCIILADAFETKNWHLRSLCDCDIVSGSRKTLRSMCVRTCTRADEKQRMYGQPRTCCH